MREPVVLTIGEHEDWSADSVAGELDNRGIRNYRLDTADFPQRMKLSAQHHGVTWRGRIDTLAGRLRLDEVTAVYYRKPRQFDPSGILSAPERRFAIAQARAGVGGILSTMRARWMNMPSKIADAESKPYQLCIASMVGLRTPPTLITNEPDQVRTFAADVGRLVVKPLAEPIVHEGGGYTPIYARLVGKGELDSLAGVDATAHLFQAWVPKAHEVRATVVGRQIFAVAIHAYSEAARVDWRTDYSSLRYEVTECPAEVAEGIRRYVQALDLTYGAFDFVVTPEGAWVFLECNASGQWGWLAEECRLPIARAIADELTGTG